MQRIKYGQAFYCIYTIEELDALNIIPNRYLWISDGNFYCIACGKNTKHRGYSHKGKSDQYLVCDECKKCVNRFDIERYG